MKKEGKEKRPTETNPKQVKNGNKNIHINNYLNCKRINALTKTYRLAEWIPKQDPNICYL